MLLFSGQTTARASASWAVVWLGFASAFSAPVTLALRLAGRQCVRLFRAVAAPLSAPAAGVSRVVQALLWSPALRCLGLGRCVEHSRAPDALAVSLCM